jgi:hypothetical protein
VRRSAADTGGRVAVMSLKRRGRTSPSDRPADERTLAHGASSVGSIEQCSTTTAGAAPHSWNAPHDCFSLFYASRSTAHPAQLGRRPHGLGRIRPVRPIAWEARARAPCTARANVQRQYPGGRREPACAMRHQWMIVSSRDSPGRHHVPRMQISRSSTPGGTPGD